MVHYIITPVEKEVFNQLQNDKERDTFIELFWQQRDPTKGTPQNEFKDEHVKRFEYAQRYFKYGTSKPGWRTDRGRIYILLGAPETREPIDKQELYPMEVWTYRSQPNSGMPSDFRVVFFRPRGSGELRIYDPLADGPESLVSRTSDSLSAAGIDYYAIYQQIREISTLAAEVSVSLIPGSIPTDYHPTAENSFLLARIYETPLKNVNATYATNFAHFKGLVDVDVAMEYVESYSDTAILRDPTTGLLFLHFAIQPKKISVDFSPEKGQYYFSYKMSVSLHQGENQVFQYNKTFPLYMGEDELPRLSAGYAIGDMMPILPGNYRLTVLVQNSVKKEFSSFDADIVVDEEEGKPFPRLYGPFVATKILQQPRPALLPYRVQEFEITPNPKGEFAIGKTLKAFFCMDTRGFGSPVTGELNVRSKPGYPEFKKSFPLGELTPDTFFCREVPMDGLAPNAYFVSVNLFSQGIPLQVKEKEFSVSPLGNVPEPGVAFKMIPLENRYIYFQMVGGLARSIGKKDKALESFRKAWEICPVKEKLAKEYALFLLESGNGAEALSVIENLKGSEREKFEYLSIRGRALALLGKDVEALESMLAANKIYDSDTDLLNDMGRLFLKIGNKEEAVKVLKASLKLKKEQPETEALLKSIK